MPKEKDLLKAKGKEKFPFGKHQGKTFEQIAFADPEYHKRYLYILGKKNKKPHGALAEYIDWFEMTKAKKTKTAGEGKGKSAATKFSVGCHKGKTFSQVAREDPSYHLRCRKVGQNLNGYLPLYEHYFNAHGDQQAALRASERRAVHVERFSVGRHRGKSFSQVAREDPSYHLRCRETGYDVGGMLDQYESYFSLYGDHHAASQGERQTLADICGIGWLVNY